MKLFWTFVSCGISLCAMDYEEKAQDKDQLQGIICKKDFSAEEFKSYIKDRPNLVEITINSHHIDEVLCVEPGIDLNRLIKLNLSTGALKLNTTVSRILKLAPILVECNIAYNQLVALSEHAQYDDMPEHNFLQRLDCSHNKIEKINFTALHRKLPQLQYLNVSGCPLKEFNIDDLNSYYVVTTIDLRQTALPDSEKKKIVKNKKETCVIDLRNDLEKSMFYFCYTVLGVVFAVSPVPLIMTIPSACGIIGATLANNCASLTGAGGLTYLGALGCKAPKNRFKSVYKPLIDDADGFAEEEITTRYSRFVKNFPYFFKGCKGDNPEYAPLNQVEEHQ
jgi:hypothetical protein